MQKKEHTSKKIDKLAKWCLVTILITFCAALISRRLEKEMYEEVCTLFFVVSVVCTLVLSLVRGYVTQRVPGILFYSQQKTKLARPAVLFYALFILVCIWAVGPELLGKFLRGF